MFVFIAVLIYESALGDAVSIRLADACGMRRLVEEDPHIGKRHSRRTESHRDDVRVARPGLYQPHRHRAPARSWCRRSRQRLFASQRDPPERVAVRVETERSIAPTGPLRKTEAGLGIHSQHQRVEPLKCGYPHVSRRGETAHRNPRTTLRNRRFDERHLSSLPAGIFVQQGRELSRLALPLIHHELELRPRNELRIGRSHDFRMDNATRRREQDPHRRPKAAERIHAHDACVHDLTLTCRSPAGCPA
jgi:hypothetical protein